MNATRSQLAKQFALVKSYLPVIKAAGEPFGFPAYILLAIGSRETNFAPRYKTNPGDHGFGHSWWQIDKRSYPEFVASGDWKDPEKAVKKAAEVLDEKRNEVSDVAVRDDFSPDTILRIAIAGYNCGSGPAYHNYMKHTNPDRGTTGGDYSLDVLERAGVFEELLAKDEPAPTPDIKVTVEAEQPKVQPSPPEITPATATVVTASQPSLKSRIVAFGHWIVAGLAALGVGIDAIWNKVLGFASDHTLFLILIIFAGILVIVGAWLYDRSMERANQRTLKIADLAADQNKNNVYLGESK